MQFYNFKYLAAAASRLIPKWAKNWEHLDQVPEFREALEALSPNERKKSLEAWRKVGWRLSLAFHTDDEYERDWLLHEARRIITSYFPVFVIATNSSQPNDKVEMRSKDNPADSLLRFVQKRLVKRMAVCPREDCKKKFYFRDPGRHGQKYCGQLCSENANREGKLRCYHTSPNSRKNRSRPPSNAK